MCFHYSHLHFYRKKKKSKIMPQLLGILISWQLQVIYLIFSDYVYELKLRSKDTGFDAKDCTLKPNCSIKCVMKKQTMWFPIRSYTKRPVQAKKMAKWRNCTIRVAKTKALISFAVTAKLICIFVFAYAKCLFS